MAGCHSVCDEPFADFEEGGPHEAAATSVVVVTAAVVILQLLHPPTYFSRTVGERPDFPATMLRVFAILIAGAKIMWLNPRRETFVPLTRAARRFLIPAVVIVTLAMALWGIVLWQKIHVVPSSVSTPSPPPAPVTQTTPEVLPAPTVVLAPSPPPVPTLDELAGDIRVQNASAVLSIYVDITHETFDQLHADDRDKLCVAGRAIRESMRAHHNPVADLNHAERAIYDITAPAGRCRLSR